MSQSRHDAVDQGQIAIWLLVGVGVLLWSRRNGASRLCGDDLPAGLRRSRPARRRQRPAQPVQCSAIFMLAAISGITNGIAKRDSR